jgi:hypothetical protein
MAGKLEATIVVRCTKEMKRELDKWAQKNNTKPGEMTRKLLETALGLQEEQWQLPPGIKQDRPA